MSKKPCINAMHASPRCCAKSKRSGFRCKAPAVKGKRVCRMHGARAGAPTGQANGNWRHGGRERKFTEMLKATRELHRIIRAMESADR